VLVSKEKEFKLQVMHLETKQNQFEDQELFTIVKQHEFIRSQVSAAL
jgi:hypothetical protein